MKRNLLVIILFGIIIALSCIIIFQTDFISRLNVMGTMLYLIKDFKDHSKWSIEYWRGYINGI